MADQCEHQSVTEILQSARAKLLQQRKSIMEQDTDRLLETSQSVHDLLQEAVESGRAGDEAVVFDPDEGCLVPQSDEVYRLLRSIRDHAQLNSELLADAVAFADLTIEALKPDSATYDASGERDLSGVANIDRSA